VRKMGDLPSKPATGSNEIRNLDPWLCPGTILEHLLLHLGQRERDEAL
jgi:hypothetical protein